MQKSLVFVGIKLIQSRPNVAHCSLKFATTRRRNMAFSQVCRIKMVNPKPVSVERQRCTAFI